ncbi:hypothetical protein V1517DRAFT_327248 [Lipomyces orientalis]|uniref:Uncharacterized protein n=1 Tax=Lipomyces orientalis TaxID=1233043 RepID=A0ACC3TK28_9ASCO
MVFRQLIRRLGTITRLAVVAASLATVVSFSYFAATYLVSRDGTVSTSTYTSPLTSTVSKDDTTCLNPYAQKGYVWFSDKREEINTTWVPFYSGLLNQKYAAAWNEDGSPAEPVFNAADVYSDDRPPSEVLDTTPHKWMQDIARLHLLLLKGSMIDEDGIRIEPGKKGKELTVDEQNEIKELEQRLFWVKHRRIVILSDSVERYQHAFLCGRLGQAPVIGPYGAQTTTWCHVPYLNFTVLHWHLSSTSTSRPDWWWLSEMKVVPIEERWKKYYLPTVNLTIGVNGKSPDLVIFQSSLWDHRMFVEARRADKHEFGLDLHRPLNWRELRFYMQRIRYIVGLFRELYGDDFPLLYRATTLRREKFGNVGLYDLGRAARFVAHELDIEIMEFGQMVQGYEQFYFDIVHIGKGPLSVLWANMVFWYLFRALGGVEVKGQLVRMPNESGPYKLIDNWDVCHDVYMKDPK